MGSSSSKKSAYSRTVYGDTTTSNPYAYSKTDNNGTISGFQDNTALQSVYNFVNNNINSLLNEYLQPNLNSVTNKAKMRAFADSLSSQSRTNLENNIINPLSQRNMIRSSQAQDLYRNLEDKNLSSLTSYLIICSEQIIYLICKTIHSGQARGMQQNIRHHPVKILHIIFRMRYCR